MASVRAGALCFERGLAPEAAEWRRKDRPRTCDYRDDEAVDALAKWDSMATS